MGIAVARRRYDPRESKTVNPRSHSALGQKPAITLRPVPFGTFLLLVLGVLLVTEVRLIGTLWVGELLLIPVALVALGAGVRRTDYELWKFVGFYCLTLTAYIATDLINGTAMNDALRAWARVGFVIVTLVSMRLILKKSRFNLLPVFIGMMAGDLVMKRDVPFANLWKYFISALVISMGLYLIAWFGNRLVYILSCGFLCAVAVFSVVIDSRAVAGFCLIVAGVLGARVIAMRRLKILFPMFFIGGIILACLVSWLLLNETDDTFGRRRNGSNVSRLASIYTAAETVVQHPILGVGSWSQLAEAADRHRQNSARLGQMDDNETTTQNGHSTILQSWTEAGVVASLAFFYYFWRLLRSVKWMLAKPLDRFYAVELFLLVNGIWNLLFSPFNGAMRIYVGITTCICIVLAEEKMLFDRNAASRRKMLRQIETERLRGGPVTGLQSA